jgi:hypothetical protein
MTPVHGDQLGSYKGLSSQHCLRCAASKPYALVTMNMHRLDAQDRAMELLSMPPVMKQHIQNSSVSK